MSIWNDCEETNSRPFYGFPVQVKVEDNILIFNFPKGYKPGENKVPEVADKIAYLLGDLLQIDENSFIIKMNSNKLARFIYHAQFDFIYDPKAEIKISKGSWGF